MKQIQKEQNDDNLEDLKNSDFYKEAINLFPDLEILKIKNLVEESNE